MLERSRRGHQHRKDLGQCIGRQQGPLVARQCAHGAQHVHALGERGARHEIQGEGRDASRHEPLNQLELRERLEHADQATSLAQHLHLVLTGTRMRTQGLDPHQDVRLGKDLLRIGADLRTRFHVFLVGASAFAAGTGFDPDLEPGFQQASNRNGHEGHAPLPGSDFTGYSDDHLPPSVGTRPGPARGQKVSVRGGLARSERMRGEP